MLFGKLQIYILKFGYKVWKLIVVVDQIIWVINIDVYGKGFCLMRLFGIKLLIQFILFLVLFDLKLWKTC